MGGWGRRAKPGRSLRQLCYAMGLISVEFSNSIKKVYDGEKKCPSMSGFVDLCVLEGPKISERESDEVDIFSGKFVFCMCY